MKHATAFNPELIGEVSAHIERPSRASTGVQKLIGVLTATMSVFAASSNAAAAEPTYFNQYILKAYQLLKAGPRGAYDKDSYFTKDLNYGVEKEVIKHG